MLAHTSYPGGTGKNLGPRPALDKSARLHLKNKLKKAKRAGGVAQVTESA
jgi:hypothetical protein